MTQDALEDTSGACDLFQRVLEWINSENLPALRRIFGLEYKLAAIWQRRQTIGLQQRGGGTTDWGDK